MESQKRLRAKGFSCGAPASRQGRRSASPARAPPDGCRRWRLPVGIIEPVRGNGRADGQPLASGVTPIGGKSRPRPAATSSRSWARPSRRTSCSSRRAPGVARRALGDSGQLGGQARVQLGRIQPGQHGLAQRSVRRQPQPQIGHQPHRPAGVLARQVDHLEAVQRRQLHHLVAARATNSAATRWKAVCRLSWRRPRPAHQLDADDVAALAALDPAALLQAVQQRYSVLRGRLQARINSEAFTGPVARPAS